MGRISISNLRLVLGFASGEFQTDDIRLTHTYTNKNIIREVK